VEKLNFKSALLIEDFEFMSEVMSTEILERTKIYWGSYLASGGEHGIVAADTPVGTTDDTDPFYVSSPEVFKVNVNAGFALTQTGELIIADPQTNLDLADPTLNAINFVIAEYHEVGEDYRPSLFDNTLIPSRQVRDTAIQVITQTDYNDVTKFPTSRKENVIVLASAFAFLDASSGTNKMSIDMTQNTYSFIRPWFSLVDNKHRSQVGSGLVTANNPHGIGLNDLTSQYMTLFQQFLSFGKILSKDVCVRSIAGLYYSESFESSAILTDDALGSVTGVPNSNYIILSQYPIYLGAIYETGVPQNKYAGGIRENSNILILGKYEVAADLTVEYHYSPALEPPSTISSNNVVMTQPNVASEILISEGVEFSEISNPAINFEGTGPIPKDFRVFLNGLGNLIRNPNLILPATKLAAISTPLAFDTSLTYESYIVVGLTLANSSGMSIVLRLTGKDINGVVITEDLTFDDSNWSDSVVPATQENPQQSQKTTQKFNEITTIEVVSRSGDGVDSTIIVYADFEAAMYQALPVLDVFWDGQAVSRIRKLPDPIYVIGQQESALYSNEDSPIFAAWLANLYLVTGYLNSSTSRHVLTEDFNQPKWRDLATAESNSRRPFGTLSVVSADLVNGDQSTIAPSKVLTALSNVPLGTVRKERFENVTTIEVSSNHYFATGYKVDISSMSGANYNSTNSPVTVLDIVTFTYANTGDDEGKHRTATRKRISNIATLTLQSEHGLTTGQVGVISNMTDTSYNSIGAIITVIDTLTIQYSSAGPDEGITTTAWVKRFANVSTVVTAAAHGLVSGQAVDISGVTADGNFSAPGVIVTVINSTTFTYPNVGLDVGTLSTATRKRISNVSTITTAAVHQLVSGQTVDISSMGDPTYDDAAAVVTVIDPNTFTYPNTGSDEGTLGTLSRKRLSGVAHITTAANHGLATGQTLNVSGMGNATYDATGVTITVTGLDSFSYVNAGVDEGRVGTFQRSRSSNVALITTQLPHLLTTGQVVNITNMTDASYNVLGATITVLGASSFTYANTGPDEVTTVDNTGIVDDFEVLDAAGTVDNFNILDVLGALDYMVEDTGGTVDNFNIEDTAGFFSYLVTDTGGVVELVADPEVGEFLYDPADDDLTRTNIVTTVGDAVFNSQVVAVNNGSEVELTANFGNTDSNFLMSVAVGTVGALVTDGYKNGFKGEVALDLPLFEKLLRSDAPGSNPETVARKYRIRAIDLEEATVDRMMVVCHGLEPNSTPTIRVLQTFQARPDTYQPEIIATPTGSPNVLEVIFPEPVAKFYLEVFGNMTGISVYTIS